MYRTLLACLTIFEVASLLCLAVNYHSPYDYCDKNYCPKGKQNIGCGCNFDASYGKGCVGKNAKLHKFTDKERQHILYEHNVRRNRIACGHLNRFPSAERMVQLRMDGDLQTLAECNAKNCTYGHDECRSTERFRYAGQNIAKRTVCGRELKITDVVNSSMHAWFDEYWDTKPEMLVKYPSKQPHKPIGHFTLIVNDNVYFIGCALISYAVQIKEYFSETGENCRAFYFVCNYSFINLKDKATYRSAGKPASKCRSGRSKHNNCLCTDHEPYSTILDWEDQIL